VEKAENACNGKNTLAYLPEESVANSFFKVLAGVRGSWLFSLSITPEASSKELFTAVNLDVLQ
jgi:hypothetical protein